MAEKEGGASPAKHPRTAVDNSGAFAGRDNTGIQQIFRGPVTVHHTKDRSAFEADTGGQINAAGAEIPADLAGFAKASTGGVINMPGAKIVRNEDGSLSVNPTPAKAPLGAAKRDVGLNEALAYIAFSEWSVKPLEQSDSAQLFNSALEKFHQAAADGELRVWGRNYTAKVYEEIPSGYWTKHQVAFLSLFRDEAHVDEDTLPLPPYRGLMVSKAEIESAFPRKYEDFLPLQHAIKVAFEDIEGTTFGKFLAAKPRDERVGWIVSTFQAYGPLWGSTWPSANVRLLDQLGKKNARWEPGTNSLFDLTSQNVLYENVSIKNEALQDHIKRMRGWTSDDINNGRW